MKYRINRAVAEQQSAKYPIDLTAISDEDWVKLAYELIEHSRWDNQIDRTKPAMLTVKFLKPSKEESQESMIADVDIRFMLKNENLINLIYDFDSKGLINEDKTSYVSSLWRKTLLFSKELREKFSSHLDE